jgi:tripartite-type tricarboxylate transporter receptor subunit TctC
MKPGHFIMLALSALLFAANMAAAQPAAQPYPAKPVRVLVPWPPGGSNDIVARLLAQRFAEQMGQQFVIDNRGGASGSIGTEVFARTPPDGHTLLVTSATHVANPHLYRKLSYDALKDFIGVAPLAIQVGMLVVHPALPVKNVKEFLALARARPGELIYGSSGNGSYVHLAMALFNQMAGTRMIHVPYKGGGPAAVGIASGETQAMIATVGTLLAQLNAKQVRPLGVGSLKRLAQFPEVPTISEAGLPGYDFTAWVGLFVLAGTPPSVVERLSSETRKALEHRDMVRILTSQSLDPWFVTPDQFAERLKSDSDKYAKLIKLSGATID